MDMIKTYQGYFREDGRFITDSLPAQIPARRRAIVNVLEDEVVEDAKATSLKQKEALNRLYIGLSKIDDEPLDDEFDAIMTQRFNIGRELDL